MNNDEAWVSEK